MILLRLWLDENPFVNPNQKFLYRVSLYSLICFFVVVFFLHYLHDLCIISVFGSDRWVYCNINSASIIDNYIFNLQQFDNNPVSNWELITNCQSWNLSRHNISMSNLFTSIYHWFYEYHHAIRIIDMNLFMNIKKCYWT